MKKYLLSAFLFLILATPALANTQGYAWSESLGWFDFSQVVVSDTALTGYAYNDNTGWLVLDGVTNTDGTLSGYAWSESTGYVDFSEVIISGGTFSGYAYNDNTGWLSFEDGTTVTTTWAPATPTSEPARSSSRSSVSSRIKNLLKMGNTEKAQQLQAQYPNTPKIIPTNTPASTQTHKTLASNPRDLEHNTQGEDVKLLQQFLNQQGFSINTPGAVGSTGYETNYFGSLTKQALIKFQQTHNITPSAGYFGPKTRAFINTLTN